MDTDNFNSFTGSDVPLMLIAVWLLKASQDV